MSTEALKDTVQRPLLIQISKAHHSLIKTYCDGPPVTKLTDGVGQDESGKPENSQELREEKKEEKAKNKKMKKVIKEVNHIQVKKKNRNRRRKEQRKTIKAQNWNEKKQ